MTNNIDDIFSANAAEKPSNTQSPQKKPFDKASWAEEKQIEREQVYSLMNETAEQVASNGNRFKEFLNTSARLNLYSTGNTLLILAQKPDATKLADFEKWKGDGSFVNKGEKGINILEPGEEYTRDDGSIGVNYNVKKVFDISQTNADQKTQPIVKHDERILLKALMGLSPVPINISDNLPGNLNALYQSQDKVILVRKGMDGQSIFCALSQEIAHARMDDGNYNRNNSDFCAVAVSYILSKRNGVDVNSYDFSKMPERFASLDVKEVRGELTSIRSVCDEMVKEMDTTLNPPHKTQSKNTPVR